MRLSLDTIGYGGYFTAPGETLSLEESIKRSAKFGYDAACIYAHRPLGFPVDLDQDRRKRLRDLYQDLDLEVGTIVCCTNFQEGNHVLVYPQEKEILYVRECIKLAKDMGSGIVRILASFYGYFQNLYAQQGYGLPAFESRSRIDLTDFDQGIIPISGTRRTSLEKKLKSEEVVLGIRPEHLKLEHTDGVHKLSLKANVLNLEPLGSETIVYLRPQGGVDNIIKSMTHSDYMANLNEVKTLSFNEEDLYIFDQGSGDLVFTF